jgi:predicted Zn-dependent protease
LRQLAQEAPGDRTVQVELGKALAQTGEPQEALGWLASALAAGYPDEKGALHALLGRLLRKLGRENEAVRAEAEARRLSDAFQAHATKSTHGSSDEDQSAQRFARRARTGGRGTGG